MRGKSTAGGRERLPLSFFIIIGVSLLALALAFLLRVREVGWLVSLADALLLSSAIPLSASAFILVYRHGGFDIFVLAAKRLVGGGCDYSELVGRTRGGGRLMRPLLVFGGAGLLFALFVTVISFGFPLAPYYD